MSFYTPPYIILPMHKERIGEKIHPRGIVWHDTAMVESSEMALAKIWSKSKGKGNGAHCIIRRSGQIIQLCDFFHNSNHAGGHSAGRIQYPNTSRGPAGLYHPNNTCIGIELSCPGRVVKNSKGWKIAWSDSEFYIDSHSVITDEALGINQKSFKWGWVDYTTEQRDSAKYMVKLCREEGILNEKVAILRQTIKGIKYPPLAKGSMSIFHSDLDPSRRTDPGPLWNTDLVIN